MDFDTAKKNLIKFYGEIGLSFVSEDEVSVIFKDEDEYDCSISYEHIQSYADVADKLGEISSDPVSPHVYGKNFSERLIRSAGAARGMALRNRTYVFGVQGGDEPWIEIGAASSYFVNHLRFLEPYIEHVRAMIEFDNDVESALDGIFTIKICNVSDPLNKSYLEIMESKLFELAYTNELRLTVAHKWQYISDKTPQFRYRPAGRETSFPMKPVKYNQEVVRFYIRGSSILDPYIQFLSYYHVVEYYFLSVSDGELYEKMKIKFADPMFRPVPKYLDGLISVMSEHKTTSDETDMFKSVISKFISNDELSEFIKKYESSSKQKIYTNGSSCFGYDLDKINLEKGHIYGGVARRMKTIRNALVHSSDRYERKDRYVPGDAADATLKREVPLMKFLAERIIIASATA